MKKAKKIFIGIVLLSGLFVLGVFYYQAAINKKNVLLSPLSGPGKTVEFVIEEGQSIAEIAQNLKKAELLHSPTLFNLFVKLNNLSSLIQAGRYDIPQNLSLAELVALLRHGTFDLKLTFIEGWRREEMAEYLNAKSSLREVPAERKDQKSKIGEEFLRASEGLEGYLFPDTYFVSPEVEAKDLVKMMRGNFERKFTEEMKRDTARVGLTLEEIVNLASIVERESKFSKDRPLVAGVLLKRYKSGWLLEADATVQYAISNSKLKIQKSKLEEVNFWPEKITKEDLEVDSPYNTRKYAGLPPTPICNPGLEALKAVVYPQDSPYWYYVSDKEGKMHYAETLEDHLENVATYL